MTVKRHLKNWREERRKTDASVHHNSSVFNKRCFIRERGRWRSNYPETVLKQCDRKRALCANNSRTDRLCDRAQDIKTPRERAREDFVWMTTKLSDWQMREEEERSFTLWFGFLLVWRCCEATVYLQHNVTQISEHQPTEKKENTRHHIFFYTEIKSLSFDWTEVSSRLFIVLLANDGAC